MDSNNPFMNILGISRPENGQPATSPGCFGDATTGSLSGQGCPGYPYLICCMSQPATKMCSHLVAPNLLIYRPARDRKPPSHASSAPDSVRGCWMPLPAACRGFSGRRAPVPARCPANETHTPISVGLTSSVCIVIANLQVVGRQSVAPHWHLDSVGV